MTDIRTFQFTVAAPPSGVPRWIDNTRGGLAVGSWGRIANGASTAELGALSAGQKFDSTVAQVLTGDNAKDITGAWNGATYDTDRKELLYVANGGHSNGRSNAVYALALGVDTPYWRRLLDSTPYGSTTYTDGVPMTSYATHADGRPRGMHTYGFPTYVPQGLAGGDRVWFPLTPKYSSPTGGSTRGIFSLNRAAISSATYSGGLGPWEMPSPANLMDISIYSLDFGNWTNGACALGGNGMIWGVGGSEATTVPYWKLDTTTGVGTQIYGKSFGGTNLGWFVYDPTRDLFYRGGQTGGRVDVLNPTTQNWTHTKTLSGPYWTNTPTGGNGVAGATVHNGFIYVCGPCSATHRGRIYKITVPSDLNNTWTSELVTGSDDAVGVTLTDPVAGTYGRARLVAFDSYAAMVWHGGADAPTGSGGYNQPVYVFRIS